MSVVDVCVELIANDLIFSATLLGNLKITDI